MFVDPEEAKKDMDPVEKNAWRTPASGRGAARSSTLSTIVFGETSKRVYRDFARDR